MITIYMSASSTVSDKEVEEYVRMFPLGRTRSQIQENFSQFSKEEINSILQELVDEGTLLETSGEFRWTG